MECFCLGFYLRNLRTAILNVLVAQHFPVLRVVMPCCRSDVHALCSVWAGSIGLTRFYTLMTVWAQERFKKEQEFLAKERAREREARKEAFRKEQERIQKAEQARLETERILEQQQKLVEARKRDMAQRDAEREAVKLEKQKVLVRVLHEAMSRFCCLEKKMYFLS
jgi:hypothetical protein